MTEKKFKKLREINRNKNYFFKKLRFNLAKIFIDKWSKKQFHLGDIKKILFLRDDNKIGDMIVSTPILRELSLNGFKLHVLSGPSNYCVIENNPYIDKVYFYPGKNIDILNLGLKLKQEKYDLVIDMGDQIPVIYLLFIRLINAKNTIGFNKDDINIYNKSIKYLNYHSHITERYKSLMNNIGIDNYNMQYDIHIPQVIKDKVCDFYTGLSGNITVVINPFTADEKRDLSKEQLIGIMSHLNCLDQSINIILVGQLEKLNALSYLSGCVVNPFGDFLSAVEIIKHADLVISPDTSIVHVAAAYKKNTVALYGNDKHGCFINNDVWGPGNKNAVQLVQNKNNSKISEMPLEIIVEQIDAFFSTLAKKI